MKRTISITTALGLAVGALALGTASTADSAPKPGFAPGSWRGSGTVSGRSIDGPMTTQFNGRIRFTFTVASDLAVKGSGSWAMTMKGTGPVGSTMKGTAALTMSGTGSDVRFSGMQHVKGVVSDGAVSRPIGFDRPLKGRLVITRAGTCKVTGTTPMGGGLKFTWTATSGTGTCL
jgi:hypothetical protein